jgi:hypothetical protein
MTTITTQRNTVITEAPEPDDVMVEVILFGEGDTPGTVCARKLRHLPITHYQECLDWAVAIADQMARPVYVVPLNHNDIFRTKRWDPYREAIAGMDHQERGELRRLIVTTAAEVMRDSDDPEIRADMFHVLRQLKVTYES